MKIRSRGDRLWNAAIIAVLLALALVTLYPFIYVFSASVSDPAQVIKGKVSFFPIGFSLRSYQLIIEKSGVWQYYYNTLWYTIVGVAVNIVVTLTFAYPMSRRSFCLRKQMMGFLSIPLFISGGMIPSYILINRLGLYNTRWALILPFSITIWLAVMTRVFFQTSIPESLIEAAKLDGGSEMQVLMQIVVPLSKPIIAVVAMYNAVNFWNMYFYAMLYTPDKRIQPLQVFLEKLVVRTDANASILPSMGGRQSMLDINQMKFSIIIFSILPIICMFPLLQKYFQQGVMIGSLKE